MSNVFDIYRFEKIYIYFSISETDENISEIFFRVNLNLNQETSNVVLYNLVVA